MNSHLIFTSKLPPATGSRSKARSPSRFNVLAFRLQSSLSRMCRAAAEQVDALSALAGAVPRVQGEAVPGQRLPRGIPAAFLALVIVLGAWSEALSKPVVSVFWDGRGGFTVMGNQLNWVSAVELQIAYKSDEQTPPRVTGRGLGAKAAIELDGDTPGSLKMQMKSDTPLSGNVMLASIAPLAGVVTHVTAWLRNDKGTMESAGVKIVNPTDEQLDKLEEKQRSVQDAAPAPPAKEEPGPVSGAVAVSKSREASDPAAAVAVATEAQRSPLAEEKQSSPVFRRKPSVLELFRAHDGARSEAALAALFRRSDEMFAQKPTVLLSDGRASLTLAIRTPGDRAPRFVIAGGDCTGLKVGEEGEWLLEIVPARGALQASVTVLTDEEMIEFPLAVAPPLALFDPAAAPPGVAEYVTAANRLVAEWRSGARE